MCRYVVKCNSARRWLFRVILFFPHPQQDPLPQMERQVIVGPGGGRKERAASGGGKGEMTTDSSTGEFDWPQQDAWRQEALDRKPPTAAGRARVRGGRELKGGV